MTDFQSIKNQAHETGVPLDWALKQRRGFVQAQIDHYRDLIRAEHGQTVTSHLERKLSNKHITEYIREVKYWKWQLTKLSPDWNKDGKHINRETIAQAKAYPIANLLPDPPKRYMTKCPFHKDTAPSGYIKGNFLYCFSCQKGWDTIELMMDLHGLTFKQAVLTLARESNEMDTNK